MNIKRRMYAIISLATLTTIAVLFLGCGEKNSDVPDGSTIQINPSSVSLTNPFLVGDVIQDYTVVARFADGTPIPEASISISGSYAFPAVNNTGSVTAARYQFYNSPGGNLGGGSPVNNGFTASTDSSGFYKFSIVIFSSVTVGGITIPNSFTDTINVMSGTAIGSTTIDVSSSLTST